MAATPQIPEGFVECPNGIQCFDCLQIERFSCGEGNYSACCSCSKSATIPPLPSGWWQIGNPPKGYQCDVCATSGKCALGSGDFTKCCTPSCGKPFPK